MSALEAALQPRYNGDKPSGEPIGEDLVQKLLANELRIRKVALDSTRREMRRTESEVAKYQGQLDRLRERHAKEYRAIEELEAQITDSKP